MSGFDINFPRGAAHHRAIELLRVLEGNELSRSDVCALLDCGDFSSRQAIQVLRDAKLIYICRYDPTTFVALFTAGNKPDVQRPKLKYASTAAPAPKPFKMPAPDPLLAALFAGRRG